MFCSNCGKEASGNFCSYCGTSLENGYENEMSKKTKVLSWDAPIEFYETHSRAYTINPKILEVAKRYKIIDQKSELTICYGTYYSNIDSIIIFVKTDEVVIAKINDAKPQNNIIKRFSKNSDVFAKTYNSKKLQFESDELLGFKISKANEISLNKKHITYFEMLKIVLPDETENYFSKTLKSTFKTQAEIEQKEKEKAARKQASKELIQRKVEIQREEKEDKKRRLEQLERDGIAYCPKCHSTSLTAHKKGFGVGKAVVGAAAASVVFAPIGLVAGNIGAKKVRVTCLKCGHQFWAGQK